MTAKEWFLADGTRLADVSDEKLDDLKGSFGKYMDILGRTPHYRRKNLTNIEMFRRDMALIEAEQERRRSLNTVNIGGWEGYVKRVHPKRLLWLWTAEEYNGQYADDAIPILKVDGKLHFCPADRTPSHFALNDELYELEMDCFLAYRHHEGCPHYGKVRIKLPGRVFKRLIHNAGEQKLIADPLGDAPWTVLDHDPATEWHP